MTYKVGDQLIAWNIRRQWLDPMVVTVRKIHKNGNIMVEGGGVWHTQQWKSRDAKALVPGGTYVDVLEETGLSLGRLLFPMWVGPALKAACDAAKVERAREGLQWAIALHLKEGKPVDIGKLKQIAEVLR